MTLPTKSNFSTNTMNTNNDGSTESDPPLTHEYDGIVEYDNPMPRWWVWIFWGSFFFSLGYFIHYHVTGNLYGYRYGNAFSEYDPNVPSTSTRSSWTPATTRP